MVYNGTLSATQVTALLNSVNFDVKTALKMSQDDIKELITQLADPNLPLIIDGVKFEGDQKFSVAATLALNNKMELLQNQSQSIVSVFSELFKMEKALGGQLS